MTSYNPERFAVSVDYDLPYEVSRDGDRLCSPSIENLWKPRIWDSWDEARSGGTAEHHAIDIMGVQGASIVATNSGVVYRVGTSEKGGNFIFIRQDDGLTSYYAHMLFPSPLREGQRVKAGQRLGYLGRTGNAATTCPHLHLSVETRAGTKINPYPELKVLYDAGGWKVRPIYAPSAGGFMFAALGLLAVGAFGVAMYKRL